MVIETSIGNYLQNLRKERKMSLRDVADHIGIDVSMLSKIEHGERQLQTNLVKPIAELFDINFKELQIQYLNYKINVVFGNEPFFAETIIELASTKNRNIHKK